MGEAKRRKQRLGSEYGQPLGLTALGRRALIQENLPQLLSHHYQVCGYADYSQFPLNPEIQASTENTNLLDFIVNLAQHWRQTFNADYPRSAVAQAMKSIIEDTPIFLTDTSEQSVFSKEIMTPFIPLPSARDYFRDLFDKKPISLSQHYILLQDVLAVLATESFFDLLQQLLKSEVTDVLNHAFEEQPDWLLPYITSDGWIDLSDEVVFIAGNRAMLGLLTLLLTLPWEIELKKLQVVNSG